MSKIIGIPVGTPLSPDKIKEKLNPVTSVNGVEADENGNVEVTAGVHSHKWNDISDAPFYDRSKSEPLNITWDGNIDGHETFVPGGDQIMVKLSDAVLTVDDLVGGTVICEAEGEETQIELTNENVVDISAESGMPALMVGFEGVMVIYGDLSAMGLPLTPGVWVIYAEDVMLVKSISSPNATITTGELKKIDPKFYDRPCYHDYEVEKLNVSFSGDPTSVEHIMHEDVEGRGFCKVSDLIVTDVNALIGGNYIMLNQSIEITEEYIVVGEGWISPDGAYILCVEKTTDISNTVEYCASGFSGTLTPGIWFLYDQIGGVTSLVGNDIVIKDELKKLDPKFLPYAEIIEKVLEAIPTAKGVSF